MYLLATVRGFKAFNLLINLHHQNGTPNLILFIVHVVDLHGIVPVGITLEIDVEQIQAKNLPFPGSYKDLNRFEDRLKLVRVLNFFILRKELSVIFKIFLG
jgi:hypothetical protein